MPGDLTVYTFGLVISYIVESTPILIKLLLKYETQQLFTQFFNQNILYDYEEVILKIVTNTPYGLSLKCFVVSTNCN